MEKSRGFSGFRDEKIVRRGFTFQRDGGRQLVREAKRVGVPTGKKPMLLGWKTLRFMSIFSEREE
jgi:hypothetical protein